MVLSNAAPRDLHLLIFAALAGTWGATFSMLGSLKSRLEKSELDELKLMRPWVMLLSRALIGTGAGCVLYFLLRSGLLGGSAFPDLAALDTTPEITRKGLALLIIWCFIAGFSEKLVPSILEKTEGRAGGTPDRFRPGPNGSAPGSTTPNVSEPAGGTAQDPPAVATAQPTDGSRPMDGASRPGLS